MTSDIQFGRKATLVVAGGASGLDLSELHFKFQVQNSDEEGPNTCSIRLYNLSADTVKQITGRTPVEYTRLVLQAGYESSFGVIFDGTIKQFRRGRENATDTYLDILAAASDIEYNFGVCNITLAAGATQDQIAAAVTQQMGLKVGTVKADSSLAVTGGALPRGKVLWGMGRLHLRNLAESMGSTWNIEDGKVNVTPLTGYLPGEAVVLSSMTGMVGIPEQTDQGIKVKCLLNAKLRIGALVQIDQASINQTTAQSSAALPVGQLQYDKYAGLSLPADVTSDGYYRCYVVEFSGDTRGQEWYTEIIGLAADISSKTVQAYG